jgi:hypothetical protein
MFGSEEHCGDVGLASRREVSELGVWVDVAEVGAEVGEVWADVGCVGSR